MRYLTLATVVGVLVLLPMSAHAIPITFTAVLSGANENPAVVTPATGFATVILDAQAHTIQINVTFSGLTSNTQAAHIHCCAAPPNNVGVATTVPAFPGFPLGVTSGNYSSPVLALTDAGTYNAAFVSMQGGLLQAEAAFVNGIQGGLTYLNIHTVTNPGGEIRGQLTEGSVSVPEPSSFVLLGSGIIGFVLTWRRSRSPLPFVS
jgi:hypothetical protein